MNLPRLALAIVLGAITSATAPATAGTADTTARPNILIIYTDDVGIGDISCYDAGSIDTPNIDRLAASGRRFTRAYATAATCTPSRFSLLTGKYAFRNDRAEILDGDAPLLIEPGSLTLPSHLDDAGYHTAVIGKWHLGLGEGDVDWNGKVSPGPLEIGFDESYLLPATNDRVPCVYLDGHHVENLDPSDPISVSYRENIGDRPTGTQRPDLLRYPADPQHSGSIINGVSRIGYMAGGHAAEWVDEELTDRFTERAIEFIERRERDDPNTPWMIYFASQQPHVPIVTHPRFAGKSGHGPRGDAILEIDWSVGELLNTLDHLGIRDETLVIFSSDNGPVLTDGYEDGSLEANGDHTPSGPYRGGKYLLWDGGTRLPFIASWPGSVSPGVSDALISQVDLLATLANIAGSPVNPDAARSLDSRDITAALLGKTDRARTSLLTQGAGGVSIRFDHWKYIPAGSQSPAWAISKHNAPNNVLNSPPIGRGPLLFNLRQDPGERTNLVAEHPERASELADMLERFIADPWASNVLDQETE